MHVNHVITKTHQPTAQASMVDNDYRLPPELRNILHSVRVFGNFEQPVFLELCKYVSRWEEKIIIFYISWFKSVKMREA